MTARLLKKNLNSLEQVKLARVVERQQRPKKINCLCNFANYAKVISLRSLCNNLANRLFYPWTSSSKPKNQGLSTKLSNKEWPSRQPKSRFLKQTKSWATIARTLPSTTITTTQAITLAIQPQITIVSRHLKEELVQDLVQIHVKLIQVVGSRRKAWAQLWLRLTESTSKLLLRNSSSSKHSSECRWLFKDKL